MRHQQLFFLALVASLAFTSCAAPQPRLKPVDQFTQAPLVENVNPGALVEIWAGNPGSLSLVATSAPVSSGSSVVRVTLSNHLSPGEMVRARQRTGFGHLFRSPFSAPVQVENNYVTNRYDNQRSGWNPNESILTVNSVRNKLGKICEHPVDAPIRAQALYVQDVDIPHNGKHNVVFVATQGDKIWAFDADHCSSNHLWQRDLLAPGETIANPG